MSTYTFSIGQKIGSTDELLSRETWEVFKRDLTITVRSHGLEIVFRGEGIGEYEGALEPSFTVIAVGTVHESSPRNPRPSFTAELWAIARHYRQDSIAVTIGETVFIGA